MSHKSQLGKYEFYPYPKEFLEPSPTLEELLELLRKSKSESKKDFEKTPRFRDRRQPRRNRRGYVPLHAKSPAKYAI